MNLAIIFLLLAAFACILAFSFYSKAKKAEEALSRTKQGQNVQDGKLDQTRQEISSLKEELNRKNKLLEEAREQARRKLRKEGQKQEQPAISAPSPDQDHARRNLAAMESQVALLKQDFDQQLAKAKEVALAESTSAANKLKEEIAKLQSELSRAKNDSQKKRNQLAKDLAQEIDLSALPQEVVGELGRLYRKAEQHERLHGLLQGKFQLAQERYLELQRRYFAVCRELAVVANKEDLHTDKDVRQFAEGVIAESDKSGAHAVVEVAHDEAASAPQSNDA